MDMLACGSNKTIKIQYPSAQEKPRILDERSGLSIVSLLDQINKCLLVEATKNLIHVWNPYTGKSLAILNGHTGRVNSVAFRPDGQILASGSHDRTIKLWGKKY